MFSENKAPVRDSSHAIVVLDRNGRVVFASETVQTLLGYPPKQLYGGNFFTLLFHDTCSKVSERFGKMIGQQGISINSIVEVKCMDGTAVWVEIKAANLLHVEGISAIVVILHGFTGEQKTRACDISRIISTAQDAERCRLAAELHDNINQLIGMSIAFIDKVKQDDNKNVGMMHKASGYLKTAMEDIRRLSGTMSGNTIQEKGLRQSAQKLVSDIMLTHQLRIVLRVDPEIEKRLNLYQQTNLYRIIQEQVQNITRHAKASKALISLTIDGHEALLRISDDGRGFDVNAPRNGNGTANMVHRANVLNGHLHIVSGPGKGTALVARFPVAPCKDAVNA